MTSPIEFLFSPFFFLSFSHIHLSLPTLTFLFLPAFRLLGWEGIWKGCISKKAGLKITTTKRETRLGKAKQRVQSVGRSKEEEEKQHLLLVILLALSPWYSCFAFSPLSFPLLYISFFDSVFAFWCLILLAYCICLFTCSGIKLSVWLVLYTHTHTYIYIYAS